MFGQRLELDEGGTGCFAVALHGVIAAVMDMVMDYGAHGIRDVMLVRQA
jgi:hypothetical protein